ncbi:MAG: helix-turn-helix transcriptional regulator [Erysipelotrichaceae bacterium]|nr:helix-turn-helix transcriptional regulator [Erysipelotrichaceae bacterium]
MMNKLGNKIAQKRKDLGLTQNDLAERLLVTRQTISRWEAGTVLPDIEKINDIADILQVSCDYLLKDEIEEEDTVSQKISGLLSSATGKKVKLTFFEDEADFDLFNTDCVIDSFEGNWMKVKAVTKKGNIEKLIPVSSVLSIEFKEEDE